jgi:Ser/Thr protein kinase RdoA (MazF antagonist)
VSGCAPVSGSATDELRVFLEHARELARHALRQWDLEVVAVEPIKVRENAVFRVVLAGGGRAVLRVHRLGYHSDAALRSEFSWMRALGGAGVAVPQVIRSRHGRDFESVETPALHGARQVDVFEWIEGRQLGSVEASIDGDAATVASQYQTIGAITARMHNQSAAWQPPADFVRHAWDAAGLVGEQPLWGRFWELAALTAAARNLLLAARARIADGLTAFGVGPDRYGLIHADLVAENILVDGSTMRVIDFDDAGFGWHLFDIATSLYFVTGDSIYPTAREALIRGYRGERALPEDAIRRLPLFMAARATTYLGWVHTRQGTETARELTPYLIERACAVAEEFLQAR